MSLSALLIFVKSHIKTLFKYVLVGLFVYLVDYLTYLGACNYLGFLPIYANIIAKIVGASVAFFLHRSFTFKQQNVGAIKAEFFRYAGCVLVNIPLFSIVFFLVSLVGLDYRVTKIIADVFSVLISYLQAKFFVFNGKDISSEK
jgi:putative flippase GtrA